MAKLFLKISTLVIIVWLINSMLFRFFKLPFLWGINYEKEVFYEQHSENYNTLFLGSSLTYRQIDPNLFDSLNKEKSISTSSFNYGLDGSTPVEIFSIYKHLLAKKPKALKNIIVELDLIDNFDMDQLHSLRRKSFFGFAQYKHALPITLQSNCNIQQKIQFLWFDFVHFWESELQIGMTKDVYQFLLFEKKQTDTSSIRDYSPLTFKEEEKEVKFLNKKYTNPHIKFITKQKEELLQNTEAAKQIFNGKDFLKNALVNTEYKNIVKEMMAIAEQKRVNLIFVLPPRLSPYHYKDLMPVYYSLPVISRIQLADANEYPDFYKLEYSYDLRHLTEPCSKIYTTVLGNKFAVINSAK